MTEFSTASEIYTLLYDRSGKKEYLYYALNALARAGEYKTVIADVRKHLQRDPDDLVLMRIEIVSLMQEKAYDEAKKRALELVSKSKSPQDYLLVSETYIKQKHYDTALKYLERAYAIDYNEMILDKMAIVLYVNLGRKNEAISHLESHSRLHGCSKVVCNRLAGFYSEQNDVDGMLSTYVRLYEVDPDEEVARSIIKIYNYKKDFPKLMVFLEKSGADDEMLLQLYVNSKLYDKAARLAGKLYDREGDIVFLGQYAIFTYESAQNKDDPEMLQEVMQTLKKVLQQNSDALYLNYLGYLMIDHDLDVEAGIGYVKKALEVEPDSPYYIDSLAWGYYKQGRCKEAYTLMQKVEEKLGAEDDEVASHLKAIRKCLKGKKNR